MNFNPTRSTSYSLSAENKKKLGKTIGEYTQNGDAAHTEGKSVKKG